ncbi:hypothetical protein FS837_011947 [Tulasnella sp. UAMH 9824]|nr:hypothetical protein FS837_011947 [Tulasnella sp. UAMH 9824]
MSEILSEVSDLDIALSILEGYQPDAVAKALENFHKAIPDFHSNSKLQAQLILTWKTDFSMQVLSSWKPSLETWSELLGTAEDAKAAVKLMLVTSGPAEVRAAIARAGDVQGGARQIVLMQALQAALKQSRPPRHPPNQANLPSTSMLGITLDKELPLMSLNNDTPVQIPTVDGKLASSSSTLNTTITGRPTSDVTTTRTGPAGLHPASSTLPSQHGSTKENIRPLPTERLNEPRPKPKPTLTPRGGGVDLARLFAADDAKHGGASTPYIPSTSIPSPNLPNPTPSNEQSNLTKPSPLLHVQAEPLQDGTGSQSKSESGSDAKELGTSTPKPKRYRRGRRSNQTPTTTTCPSPNEAFEQHLVPGQEELQRAPSPALSLSRSEDLTSPNNDSPVREAMITTAADGSPVVESFSESEYESQGSEPDESEMGSDYEDDGVESESSEVDGDKELDGGAAQDHDGPRPTEESYPDGFVDPLKPNPWTWEQETNDEKVELWGVEDLILRDPRSTAPVRTQWMYEARKGAMTDDQYAAKMQEEHTKFMEVPISCRTVVGQMWFRDSKLDWEIRVFLAPLIFKYAMLKIEAEEAEALGDRAEAKSKDADRKALVTDAMAQLMERFPDCSPNHDLRKIKEKFGSKELVKYNAKFRNKFTSDAGRMKIRCQKEEGKVGSIGAKIPLSTVMDILGRKRLAIVFQLWGRSKKGGKAICDPIIHERMVKWREEHPTADAQEASQHRIKVVQQVRRAQFDDLEVDVKAEWTKRAKSIHQPSTVEEEQCFVEACLPYVLDLLNLLAERGNMHFLLLASSQGTVDIPIAIQEFSRKDVEQTVFLSATDGLGARVRADYIAYALARFGGDLEDPAVRLATNATYQDEDDVEEGEDSLYTGETTGRGKQPATVTPTFVPPFTPDLSQTKTVPKMEKAIADYFTMAIKKLYGTRISWDNLTKNASKYIFLERMPMDPDVPGQRLQIQRPTAMTPPRVKALFNFLVSSYNGSLPEHESFRFKLDSRYSNIPAPIAPSNPEVHHAGAAAAKTRIPKRGRGDAEPKGKKSKKLKVMSDEVLAQGDDDNYESIPNDDYTASVDDAVVMSPGVEGPSHSSRKRKAVMIESPPQSSEKPVKSSLPASAEMEKSHPNQDPQSLDGLPDRPVSRARPRPKNGPKFAIEFGTDELSHPLLLPSESESTTVWTEAKEYLDLWGKNMNHCDRKMRNIPFVGLSGVKPHVDLPPALYSSLSILQLWNVFQRDSMEDFDVTFEPNLGLGTINSKHYISKAITLILDASRSLPTTKFIYNQPQSCDEAASAFFLKIETSLAEFMDKVVASEQTVLSSNLNLLQGMRLVNFMRATGIIRDGGETGINTKRTLAISDRFVQILAAVSFARYMKLVLGRVAELYAETSKDPEAKLMWNELVSVWCEGCKTLARPVVARRSDLFIISRNMQPLPQNIRSLLDYAFNARPWWTPGPKGVPNPLSLSNKQAIVSGPLLKKLKEINWSTSSFVERGRVLLALFIGAIQIETARVITPDGQTNAQSPASLLAEALKSLRQRIEHSTEDGAVEEPILIPSDPIVTWVSQWEMECQVLTDNGVEHPHGPPARSPSLPSPSIIRNQNEVAMASELEVGIKAMTEVGNGLGLIASFGSITDGQALSRSEAISTLGPEEEDPTFPINSPRPLIALDGLPRRSLSPAEDPVIPAIRRLEDASLPPAKKKRLARKADIGLEDEIDLGTRKLRSATARPPEPTLPAPPGRLTVSPTAYLAPGPSATVAKRTRSATAVAKSLGNTTKKSTAAGSSKSKGKKGGY